ncbi:MAG: Proline dipeptidase [Cytophagales bacterium]|jgi:Xaa-Pro dipeptidase|nr:aminopeptidase P family protein [Bacteroidota bacterium]MBS1982503.1 aminopeptidase P family protein [Bacteroidota bacterium]WHZ06367.1 MAG: Proline dipeptidase [Cytophagales bacterium]
MAVNRRNFIRVSIGSAASAALVAGMTSCEKKSGASSGSPVDALQSMTQDIVPISVKERESRVEKAQRLMAENKIEALVIDAGTTLTYFTGVQWWPSERTMVAIIPAKGDVKYVCPAFEEERLRQLITLGKEVRVWQEHESPYAEIAKGFKDWGIRSGSIGMEERLRFFIFDGVRKEASHLNYVSGDPVSVPCRLIKSPAELALMQRANDITIEAHRFVTSQLHEGMTPHEFSDLAQKAHAQLGASGGTMVNFGEDSAYPHGSIKPQVLKKGDIVLMDGGGSVGGYASDISRTVVFGAEPTLRQREIWDLEKKAQAAGFKAAKIGAPCENVDTAARKTLVDAGFGPGYKVPGLPHRTGHGIGMDVHEWGNMVLGNKLPLQAGMCFSIEPNISIYGEFGVRLEDCVYMTEEGPKWFSNPSLSIDQPFG